MQQASPERSLKSVRAISKEDEQNGRRQREGNPSRKTAKIAETNLWFAVAGSTRAAFADLVALRINPMLNPTWLNVRNRPTKAADSEFTEGEQHLPRRAG